MAEPGDSKRLGQDAERVAAAYLARRGYDILTASYRTRRGEIDLICTDGDCLVFVEVKAASSPSARPFERVNIRKQRKMAKAAAAYLADYTPPAGGVRFDVMSLISTARGEWKISLIQDAFRPDEENVNDC